MERDEERDEERGAVQEQGKDGEGRIEMGIETDNRMDSGSEGRS